MTNVTKLDTARDLKSARQSVRAKIRKALAVPGAELSAADTKALEGVFASLNATLAPKAKTSKADKPAKKVTAKAKSNRKPMSAKDRKAFGLKMKAAKAAKAAERAAIAA